MRTFATIIIATVAAVPAARPAEPIGHRLHARIIAASVQVGDAPILGRASCGSAVWLLNRRSELIEVSLENRRAVAHAVRGFSADARPWGLACVTDGTIWTLEAPRSLVRLAFDGTVAERIPLGLPRVALFGFGDRLLFHQLPTVAAAPVLATSLPRKPLEVRTWPGLIARPPKGASDHFAQNLINCGVASRTVVPCWFANDARVAVSDGVSARSWPIASLKSSSVDETAPIWDAAVAGSGWMWILATSARSFQDRRVGGSLVHMDSAGVERGHIALDPPARLILAATATSCLLLTARGELMEVAVK